MKENLPPSHGRDVMSGGVSTIEVMEKRSSGLPQQLKMSVPETAEKEVDDLFLRVSQE